MTTTVLVGGEQASWAKEPAPSDSATIYVAGSGSDANDGATWATAKATIPAGIAALPTNGGNVELGYGTFSVVSYGRAATPTINATNVVMDAGATMADIGAYVIGLYFAAGTKVTGVTPGVSFTTSSPALGTGTGATFGVFITMPAFELPAGVDITGRGMGFDRVTSPVSAGGSVGPPPPDFMAGTIIQDTGSGATITITGDQGANSGDNSYVTCRLAKMSVRGNSSNVTGLLVNWAAWLVDIEKVEFADHGVAGVTMGAYLNNSRLVDCIIRRNGLATCTTPSGGILMNAGNGGQNATMQFINCMVGNNYGSSLVSGSPWPNAIGLGPAYSAVIIGGNWFTVFKTTLSGTNTTNVWLSAGSSQNATAAIGAFFGSAFYNVRVTGPVPFFGCEFTGPGNTNNIFLQSSGASFVGCVFGGGAWSVTTNGHAFSWSGCSSGDTTWALLSGGATVPNTVASSPGSIGSASYTQPPAAVSVTLSSGVAWQNTTGGDVILVIPVSFAALADSVTVARGSASSPTPLGTITRVAAQTDVLEFYVPALWYFEATLGGTATFTANATAQPV